MMMSSLNNSSSRATKHGYGGKDPDDSHAASNNLWVGNLSVDVTDRDLMDLFSRYGPVDSLTSFSSRSYAFVLFRTVRDATAAKDALQGTPLHGCSLKIYFAKPAKPSRQLWVGGVSPSVSKEDLEEEFVKFGKVEEFNFFRERNAAYIVYANLEDASQALKSMSGKRIGAEQIRVDFFRSISSKREQGPAFQDYGDGQFSSRSTGPSDNLSWMPQVSSRNFSEPAQAGLTRQQQLAQASTGGRRGDGQPSTVLWVGYPPSLRIDEQMLHNAMILFGEIEGIKVFPERHYAFVEFRSVDEARRAKEGLQGRLFNDPRITIMFSSSSLAPGKGSRPPQADAFGNNRPGLANNYSGPGILGPPIRPFGSQASYEPLLPGSSFNDSDAFNKQDGNHNISIGRRLLPPSGSGMHQSSGWDTFDDSHFQREPKRSRLDGALPFNSGSRLVKKWDDQSLTRGNLYGVDTEDNEGKESVAQVGGRLPTIRGYGLGTNDNDFIWRGTIAKGGTLVCHARCLPVGKGIGSELPAVVNCCARTGLDMLTKHYAEAVGFEIVYFLPDSEHDFASYTEFLRYLGSKDRAGVAKLDDGTTLFLVPPSDFLTNILNVTGPDRLYGVVLRLPQQSPDGAQRQQQQQSNHTLPLSQNFDGRYPLEYGLDYPLKAEGLSHMDRNRVSKDVLDFPSKLHSPHTGEPYKVQPAPRDYTSVSSAATTQTSVTLTPELIATLTSLLPSKSSGLESSQPISAPIPGLRDLSMLSQGWKPDNQYQEQVDQALDHPQAQHTTQFNTYQSLSNLPHHGAQPGLENSRFHDFGSKNNFVSKTDFGFAGQSGVSQQVNNQQYQGQVLHNSQTDYGTVPGREAARFYGSTEFQAQQHNNPVNLSRPQNVMMPLAVEKASSELSNPVQPIQPILSGAGQSSTDGDADKNQRYQSTLQFAANLLLQIQQQQQQQQLNHQQ